MLHDNLKIIRKNKGYSQEELAEKIHVTRQTVSKWENGQSVPDAEMIQSIAKVYGISVSELIEGDAEKIIENEVIIDQLARINEQLIISNRKMKDRNKTLIITVISVLAVIALAACVLSLKIREEKGYCIKGPEHLGVLKYSVPYKVFYHKDNDVGVTVERDGRYRISSKLYRNYKDMTEISVWNEGPFSQDRIDEFISKHPDAKEQPQLEWSRLPEGVEYFVCSTDSGLREDGYYHIGTYYKAYVVLGGKMYLIDVTNGDDVAGHAEFIISTMAIDESEEEEYW